MRSKLFVPGSRPELFSKAMASAADAISIDLEDAVVEARKSEARGIVASWLKERKRGDSNKLVIVRVNAMDTLHFEEDIAAVVQAGIDIVNLPKPESADAVHAASALIAKAEKTNGVTNSVRLLLNIETPKSLRQALLLAKADARVIGLQVGLGDLFEPLGIDRRDAAAVQQVLFAVRMAAGEAGVDAFDGAFANVADTDGYLAEVQMARRLGFSGKSCIHPSQIALANRAFQPTDTEIAHAMQVVETAAKQTVSGVGAFLVNGHMIDAPFLRRAQSILAQAKKQ
jgi:citrate lyase beta subunit